MNNTLLALLIYAAWTLCLVVGIAVLRGSQVAQGLRSVNSFSVWGDEVSAFSGRLCRAHANCYENLPAFAAIVLVTSLTGQIDVTNPLALWLIAARIAQSTVHLISTHNRAVLLRFAFMATQIAIQAWWVLQLSTRLTERIA